jgi:hypothetical protein
MKIREEREELKNLLEKAPENIDKNVAVPGENIVELESQPLVDVDFDEIKKICEKEARVMIKNAISFMIPIDMIRENKYLKNKFKVDVMSLAGMVYQLRTNEIMQKTLMQQINSGLVHARYYEVYGQLSKTIGDINKQLLQTVEAIKSTYKGFKDDVKEQRTEALGPIVGQSGMLTSGDGSIITRGTKEIINRVKQVKNQKNENNDFIDESNLIPDLPINNT